MSVVSVTQCDWPGCRQTATNYLIGRETGAWWSVDLCAEHAAPLTGIIESGAGRAVKPDPAKLRRAGVTPTMSRYEALRIPGPAPQGDDKPPAKKGRQKPS